ncbi:hypothetical protein GBZ48_13120 [Azospirillum melinis]|uniref:Uncharacterized protein n=1 Tax=Azospirillum melinis TaxID=328839 RepID=A0ABX2KAM1_9PROT|nr:hypothetical protein [Azospirillum melinis]MBP2306288.1 hypothetical protein [Azospirillum melinis]NUB00229.1 hypothetical protein [Azospirillum melinis]
MKCDILLAACSGLFNSLLIQPVVMRNGIFISPYGLHYFFFEAPEIVSEVDDPDLHRRAPKAGGADEQRHALLLVGLGLSCYCIP